MTPPHRVAAVGVSARRVAFVCLDVDLQVVDLHVWYLRRLRRWEAKSACVRDRLPRALRESEPHRLLVEKPVCLPQQADALRLADAIADCARSEGYHTERMSFQTACVEIVGEFNAKRCAEVLAAQYEALASRIAQPVAKWRACDDRVRDRRSMLAAVAIAHAAVMGEPARRP